jgi:hypothetical protein
MSRSKGIGTPRRSRLADARVVAVEDDGSKGIETPKRSRHELLYSMASRRPGDLDLCLRRRLRWGTRASRRPGDLDMIHKMTAAGRMAAGYRDAQKILTWPS